MRWPVTRGLVWAAALGAGCGGKGDSGGAAADAVGGPAQGVTEDGRWALAYTASPDPIPFNAPFSLRWTVEAREGSAPAEALYVDVWMPAHEHGGTTLPTTTRISADGATVEFETTDLQLHMPGDWELQLRVDGGGETDALSLPYACCADYAG